MNDIEKLHHLIGHWLEHNQEHAKTYREWGEKAGSAGRPEVASLLREIAEKTAAMDELFRQAEKACS